MVELPGFLKSLRGRGKVGLALGGGAVLGAAHIGVLQAMEELDVQIDYVAGTSIGAFVGALVAFGKNAREISETLSGLNWFKAADLSLSRYGLLSNQKLADTLTGIIGDVDFKDAGIPLAVVATDISTGEKVVLNSGSVAKAVRASASIPGIFRPVEIDGKLLVDGGIIENVPVATVKEMGPEKVIAVNLMTDLRKPANIVDVLINVMHFSIIQNVKRQTSEADILLDLNLTDFNRVDTDQVPDLIEQGYRQGKTILEKAKLGR
ncbi:MAG: patatin-like phospholipase family protein [Bacillota bacterium]|nr:patatin-like phospholipase family protein [Bacillota bacterium]MDW7683719.1 patatin-like phospholipase family protein [Bacillota bacterium]